MTTTTLDPTTEQGADTAAPPAWQRRWGEQIAAGLTHCMSVHPASRADRQATAELPAGTMRPMSRLSRRPIATAAAHLAALQSAPGPGRRQAQQLYERCLAHYRQELAVALGAAQDDDDLVGAAACFLAACVQALEGHAVTPERWRALCQWLQAWAPPQDLHDAQELPAQQEAFERLAILAAAVGEWSVQAQRQGPTALAGARLMARRWLAQELGVDADALLQALRWQGLLAADNPSWDGTALPKHRTGQEG